MNLSILVDPVNEKCCLVDDDTGRAFGPVFTGEDCLAQADLFVTLAGEQLDVYSPSLWAVTERAVRAMLNAETGGSDVPVPHVLVEGATPGAELTGGPTPATSPTLDTAPPAAPADADSDAAPRPDQHPGGDPALGLDAERRPIPAGAESCWQCQGTGTITDLSKPEGAQAVPCDICDGAGYIAREGA